MYERSVIGEAARAWGEAVRTRFERHTIFLVGG
jgi:hypothetical protein